jgi:hypothetical protein
MNNFITDVETPSTVFDCTNASTTTAAAVIAVNKVAWDTDIAAQHNAAFMELFNHSPEAYAHGISNPEYVPIWSAIPSPNAPTINPAMAPIPDGFSQATITRASVGYFVVYGNYLNATPTVNISGYGVSASFSGANAFISKGQLNMSYTVTADADLGTHVVTIQTAYGAVAHTVTIQ